MIAKLAVLLAAAAQATYVPDTFNMSVSLAVRGLFLESAAEPLDAANGTAICALHDGMPVSLAECADAAAAVFETDSYTAMDTHLTSAISAFRPRGCTLLAFGSMAPRFYYNVPVADDVAAPALDTRYSPDSQTADSHARPVCRHSMPPTPSPTSAPTRPLPTYSRYDHSSWEERVSLGVSNIFLEAAGNDLSAADICFESNGTVPSGLECQAAASAFYGRPVYVEEAVGSSGPLNPFHAWLPRGCILMLNSTHPEPEIIYNAAPGDDDVHDIYLADRYDAGQQTINSHVRPLCAHHPSPTAAPQYPAAAPTASPTTSDPTTSPAASDPTMSPTTSEPTASPTASPTHPDRVEHNCSEVKNVYRFKDLVRRPPRPECGAQWTANGRSYRCVAVESHPWDGARQETTCTKCRQSGRHALCDPLPCSTWHGQGSRCIARWCHYDGAQCSAPVGLQRITLAGADRLVNLNGRALAPSAENWRLFRAEADPPATGAVFDYSSRWHLGQHVPATTLCGVVRFTDSNNVLYTPDCTAITTTSNALRLIPAAHQPAPRGPPLLSAGFVVQFVAPQPTLPPSTGDPTVSPTTSPTRAPSVSPTFSPTSFADDYCRPSNDRECPTVLADLDDNSVQTQLSRHVGAPVIRSSSGMYEFCARVDGTDDGIGRPLCRQCMVSFATGVRSCSRLACSDFVGAAECTAAQPCTWKGGACVPGCSEAAIVMDLPDVGAVTSLGYGGVFPATAIGVGRTNTICRDNLVHVRSVSVQLPNGTVRRLGVPGHVAYTTLSPASAKLDPPPPAHAALTKRPTAVPTPAPTPAPAPTLALQPSTVCASITDANLCGASDACNWWKDACYTSDYNPVATAAADDELWEYWVLAGIIGVYACVEAARLFRGRSARKAPEEAKPLLGDDKDAPPKQKRSLFARFRNAGTPAAKPAAALDSVVSNAM